MPVEESQPKWDVALASLINNEFEKTAAPLTLADFRRLANEYAIRFDDIMETLFLLAIHGEWSYRDQNGTPIAIDQETLDRLYVKRRLSEQDLSAYQGQWRPA